MVPPLLVEKHKWQHESCFSSFWTLGILVVKKQVRLLAVFCWDPLDDPAGASSIWYAPYMEVDRRVLEDYLVTSF